MRPYKTLFLAVLVLTLLLQSCSSGRIVSSPTAENTRIVPTDTPKPDTFVPFGSDIVIDQMKFTVAGAIRPADGIVAAGDAFNTQPREYHHYIFVTLRVTCETAAGRPCQLDLYKLKLLLSDDSPVNPTWFLSGVDDILSISELQGGTTVSGHVPFIIGIGDSGLKLIYESVSGDRYSFGLP